MSFIAQADQIKVTDSSIGTVFDTNQRLMYINAQTSFSFSIPSLAENSGARETEYLVATLPYDADFIIGHVKNNIGEGFDANGSILAYAIYSGADDWLVAVRFLTFIVRGNKVYANIRQENQSFDTMPAQAFTATIYAGKYDL